MTRGESLKGTGLPVVRHPFIHYPKDPEVHYLEYRFMVRPDLMVAPVLDPGEEKIEAYLPAGALVHLWSGERRDSAGACETVRAPLGEPVVFTKAGRRREPESGGISESLGRCGYGADGVV